MNWTRIALFGVLISAISLVSLEMWLRFRPAQDPMVWVVSDDLGYYPAPNQFSGNRQITELSMRDGPFDGSSDNDTLILGDSIVFGRQYDHPTIPVWQIGAGGWSLLNLLAWVDAHPDAVGRIEHFIVILNARDFGSLTPWPGDAIKPTGPPISYAWRFIVWNWHARIAWRLRSDDMAPDGNWRDPLREFCGRRHVTFVMLPYRSELGAGWDEIFADRRGDLAEQCPQSEIIDVAQVEGWSRNIYNDHVHPVEERWIPIVRDVIDGGVSIPEGETGGG